MYQSHRMMSAQCVEVNSPLFDDHHNSSQDVENRSLVIYRLSFALDLGCRCVTNRLKQLGMRPPPIVCADGAIDTHCFSQILVLNVIYCWLLAVQGNPAQDENHGDYYKFNNDRQWSCTDAISDRRDQLPGVKDPLHKASFNQLIGGICIGGLSIAVHQANTASQRRFQDFWHFPATNAGLNAPKAI